MKPACKWMKCKIVFHSLEDIFCPVCVLIEIRQGTNQYHNNMLGLYIIQNQKGANYVNQHGKIYAFTSFEDCEDFIIDVDIENEAKPYHDLFAQEDSDKIQLITYIK